MSVIGNTALSFSEEQAMLLDVAREFCKTNPHRRGALAAGNRERL